MDYLEFVSSEYELPAIPKATGAFSAEEIDYHGNGENNPAGDERKSFFLIHKTDDILLPLGV